MSMQARSLVVGDEVHDDLSPGAPTDAALVPFAGYLAMSARDPAQPVHWRHAVLEAGCQEAAHGERGTVALVPLGSTGRNGEVAPGLSMTIQVVRPGEITSPHRHAFWHLYLVGEGQGLARVGRVRHRGGQDRGSGGFPHADFQVARGDVFYVPPWASHQLENSHADDALVLYVIQNLPQLAGLGTLLREAADGTLDHVFRGPLQAADLPASAGV
jgi:gentisate 1,2-dioxygenase